MLRIRRAKLGRWAFNVWIVVFTLIVFWAIVQIQHSRVQSCKNNYEAFNKVFKPFLHPTPTPDEIKFHKNVKQLKAHCSDQVHLWNY